MMDNIKSKKQSFLLYNCSVGGTILKRNWGGSDPDNVIQEIWDGVTFFSALFSGKIPLQKSLQPAY